MRRNITQVFLALVLVLYPIVSISAEKNNASLDSYAYQIIDNILLNQKIAFESGEVFKDPDKTKLFDREELVVTVLSIPKLEGVK